MKCPYCGKEMDRGELVSSHGIHWCKERALDDPSDTIPLNKPATAKAFFKGIAEGFSVEAWHCVACKAIILRHE